MPSAKPALLALSQARYVLLSKRLRQTSDVSNSASRAVFASPASTSMVARPPTTPATPAPLDTAAVLGLLAALLALGTPSRVLEEPVLRARPATNPTL